MLTQFRTTQTLNRLRLVFSSLALLMASLRVSEGSPGGDLPTPLACNWEALRSAVAAGGSYRFTCDATIEVPSTLVISNKLLLDAAGFAVTLSGGGARQILMVQPGGDCELIGLGLRNGLALRGGAIWNQGTLRLRQVRFQDNIARGQRNLKGQGGAVDNDGGTIKAWQCQWIRNTAVGIDGHTIPGPPFTIHVTATSALGGALHNGRGTVELVECQFTDNLAQGGKGMMEPPQHRGADGSGGAIENLATLSITQCTFANNQARGGDGALWPGPEIPIYTGSGQGLGGAIANHGALSAANSTWYRNRVGARLETVGQGVFGEGQAEPHGGGAIFSDSQPDTVQLVHATFSENDAEESFGKRPGMGGAIYSPTPSIRISRSVFAHAEGSSNFAGVVGDGGYNLSSDRSGALDAATSRSGIDPFLGPLDDNGGPTQTMSLREGSPALDAAPASSLVSTDQRGVSRPQGGGFDLGAFERIDSQTPLSLHWLQVLPDSGSVQVVSAPFARVKLVSSPEVSGPWTSLAETQADAQGRSVFEIPVSGPRQFFRASP